MYEAVFNLEPISFSQVNIPFLYSLKSSTVLWFSGIEKTKIGLKWVENAFLSESDICFPHYLI